MAGLQCLQLRVFEMRGLYCHSTASWVSVIPEIPTETKIQSLISRFRLSRDCLLRIYPPGQPYRPLIATDRAMQRWKEKFQVFFSRIAIQCSPEGNLEYLLIREQVETSGSPDLSSKPSKHQRYSPLREALSISTDMTDLSKCRLLNLDGYSNGFIHCLTQSGPCQHLGVDK